MSEEKGYRAVIAELRAKLPYSDNEQGARVGCEELETIITAMEKGQSRLLALEARIAALTDALKKYGTHDPKTCALYTSDVDPVCDCGFREALNPTSAAEGKE